MKIFILLLTLSMTIHNSKLDVDFGTQADGQDWMVINDEVMGGLSEGKAQLEKNSIVFEGNVSLANNGGFASLRCPYQALDLTGYKTIEIRLKNKGVAFAFTLTTDRRYYIPYFKQAIETTSENWEIIRLELADFKQYRLGTATGVSFTEDYHNQIIRMGFISNEKRAATFELEIDYIKFE